MNEVEVVGVRDEYVAVASERPWIFGLLIAPMAVLANGLFQGALSYLLRQQGVPIERIGEIVGLLILPQTIYFLWSPITDFLLPRRTWLILGSMAGAVTVAIAFRQKNLASPAAVGLMFFGGCLTQLVVSSAGGMMGAVKNERNRRLAGSFYQGGSLAFGALAIYVLTAMAAKVSQGELGWIVAALVGLPSLVALWAPKQEPIVDQRFGETMLRVWREFKGTFLRWKALPYTLCMLFPMASGAAIGLLPGIAQDYGVSGQQVGWMNGLGGALLTAAGALAATLIPARIRATVGYLSLGILNCVTLGVLWLGPQTPVNYFIGVTLYLFTIGTCYAMFTAVILEFLGDSGKSGSGRYAIINSLGNVPVAYMTTLDGWGGKHFGPRGLPGTEAVVGAVGASILLGYFLTRKRGETAAEERAEVVAGK